jgi:hypothetical protein
MNKEFSDAWKWYWLDCEWLAWLGQPMVYDSALCVTRNAEELEERMKYRMANLEI